ncbi:MAG: hypothetical protein JXO49_10550 [Deltaproteobacteria bacterium]|nr:hypothetical protein [Deltaproteobacteria bacterium]
MSIATSTVVNRQTAGLQRRKKSNNIVDLSLGHARQNRYGHQNISLTPLNNDG